MRIVGGKYKGKRFSPPKNIKARPTTDFAKEGLFNLLTTRFDISDATVLDLFAGTGSIGFEFASRGAQHVICVDHSLQSFKFITKACAIMQIADVKVTKAEVFRYLKKVNQKFDLIFADPPYHLKNIDQIPVIVFDFGLLNDAGLLIVEHAKEVDLSKHPNFTEQRSFGKVNFSFFSA